MDMTQIITGVVLKKVISLSPDDDAKKAGDHKNIRLEVSYNGLVLGDVFTKALKTDVVSFANGSGGRKNYDNLTNNQVVKISAKSPGAHEVDPRAAVASELSTMNPEEQQEYIADLILQAKAVSKA